MSEIADEHNTDAARWIHLNVWSPGQLTAQQVQMADVGRYISVDATVHHTDGFMLGHLRDRGTGAYFESLDPIHFSTGDMAAYAQQCTAAGAPVGPNPVEEILHLMLDEAAFADHVQHSIDRHETALRYVRVEAHELDAETKMIRAKVPLFHHELRRKAHRMVPIPDKGGRRWEMFNGIRWIPLNPDIDHAQPPLPACLGGLDAASRDPEFRPIPAADGHANVKTGAMARVIYRWCQCVITSNSAVRCVQFQSKDQATQGRVWFHRTSDCDGLIMAE